jgi:predicted DNA-binding transcriptional regulator YafY
MHLDADTSRLSRLTATITILLSRRLVTATHLSERFGVSVRTVYRDIRALEAAGLPIVTEEGRGYSIMEGYKLPPVMFTEEEACALITSEQLILRNKDSSLKQAFSAAIAKIRTVLQQSSQAHTELLGERMYIQRPCGDPDSSHILLPLQLALTRLQVVHIHYQDRAGKATQRWVEPFVIFHSLEEDWTMVAYCRMRKDFRSFRIDRITDMAVTAEHFPRHSLTIQQYAEKYVRRQDP